MTRPKQRARSRRVEPAARPAAVVVFDSTVPVYMETVRETRICPELMPTLPEDSTAIESTTAETSIKAPTSITSRSGSATAAARQKTRKAASQAQPADVAANGENEAGPAGPAYGDTDESEPTTEDEEADHG